MEVRWRHVVLSALSGALLALCLPRPGLCALGWVALAPLVILCWKLPPRRAALAGGLAGFAFHGISLYWVYSTCRFGNIPDPDAPIWLKIAASASAWAALAGFLALNWGLAAALAAWTSAALPRCLKPWGWAAVWTGVAVATGWWTPRLAGDLLAYTQYRNLSLLQMASFFGPHGLGFLVAAANACLAQAWLELEENVEASAAYNVAAVAAMAAAAWACGAGALAARPEPDRLVRVEILQPNIDQYQKFDEHYEEAIRGNFIELLSRPRPENPYLIVWPESALPYWVEEGKTIAEAATWSRRLKSYQLVGAVSRDPAGNYNSAFLIGPDGEFKASYRKRELVPFGEYLPFSFLRRFIHILTQMGEITAGAPRQEILATPLGPSAASICYEAVFPRWANLDASRGSRVLLNITNDGWYKDTWGPDQHFQTNVYRAVENRVTVIRSGNTGISGVIDPWGVVTARLDLNKRGRLDALVALEDFFPRRSFYARHGDWFGALCLMAAGALMAAAALRKPA